MLTEFAVRYRLPRPIARAYETVCFAGDRRESAQRCRWCALTAVRFIAAIRQACDLADNKALALNAPSFSDFRDNSSVYGKLLAPRPSAKLLQLAGVYPGFNGASPEGVLLQCLQDLDILAGGRLAIVEDESLRILLGARLEYKVEAEKPPEISSGTPIYVDLGSGTYVSLAPLALWQREAVSPFGHFWLLAKQEKNRFCYIEAGLPGAPSVYLEDCSRPVVGSLKLPFFNSMLLPRTRFDDGELIAETYYCRGLMWRGGTSDIYSAARISDGQDIVLKTFESDGLYDSSYWHFMNEARFGGLVHHPAVIRPLRTILPFACHEQELAAKGSLEDFIISNGVLEGILVRRLVLDLLLALSACHAAGVVHNDIKPDNILFSDTFELRLIDFGIAAAVSPPNDRLRPGVPPGTVGYMAPEILEGAAPSVASDVFAVGVVTARMLTGRVLNASDVDGARALRTFKTFLNTCLDQDPGKRFHSADAAYRCLAEIEVPTERYVTLDIEGTLFDNYDGRHARPGLRDFLEFCLRYFSRIFVFTMLDEQQARDVFRQAANEDSVPVEFLDRYEYVAWQGLFKDLRCCGVALSCNAIIDDNEGIIPEDQRHLWIRVTGYHEVKGYDRGLMLAQDALVRRFDLWENLDEARISSGTAGLSL